MDKIQKKVICIGSTGKDIFFPVSSGTVVETGEKSNKTKQFCFNYGGKVHVEDRFSALGGCACNVSVGLSRLGVDVSALGYVGNDTDGMWIKETLLKEGVKTGDIKFLEEYNTDLSVVIVDANAGERTIFVNRDVGEKLRLVKNDVNGFDWCFIGSLYGDDIEYNMKVVHGELKEKNIKLAYNPGGKNIKQEECVVLDLIHHASIVFVNKSEAREIVSKFNLSYNEEELSQEVKLMSIIKEHMSPEDGIVVLTHGQKGAWA
ncbi:MAG: carbohydrate kinase family protein, partial [Patescibacteria group bacterium]